MNDDMLLLAFSLAMLTYNLGILLYSLPIPIKSIKRWGSNLIVDAISSSILISCFTLITSLASKILNILGSDWSNYFMWVSSRVVLIFSGFSVLTYISGLLKYSYIVSLLSSPINVVLGYLSAALSALKVLVFLGSFILNYYSYLMLLGVILYSIPFRIGKSAGAYLIAMSIVFYVGLPLMPAFVETFQSSIGSVSLESTEISGRVIDLSGNAVPNAIIQLYEGDEVVGTILTSSQGRFVLGNGYDLLPKNFSYRISLELYGFTFITSPENISSDLCVGKELCSLNISVPGLLTTAGGALLIPLPTGSNVYEVIVRDNEVNFTLVTNPDILPTELYIAYPKGTKMNYVVVNDEVFSCQPITDFIWYDINVNLCSVLILSNVSNVRVIYEKIFSEKPSVSERRIISMSEVSSFIATMISIGMAFIYSLVFLPSLYLILLLSISASLARFLGGRGLPIRIF